ncbi:MAG: glyoxalase/bleomycin resistance protein/dioxygenase [Osedax symbiont Rs2]|nr:MAG: glyoxalase/bleomycin resistance protein/dioxygenase [Osedax symbiont Rs2]
MRYLHTMVRVTDLDLSLKFYCDLLGLVQVKRKDFEQARFSLIFLAAPGNTDAGETNSPLLELTYNWDLQQYNEGRNFGHLAFEVDDLYAICAKLMDAGIVITRPPRDGYMAFVRSPDNISVELLQRGAVFPPADPWQSMSNIGSW